MLVLSLSHIGNAVLQCVEKIQTVAVTAAEGANSQRSLLYCVFFFFWCIFSVSVVPPLTEPAVLSTPTPQFNGRIQTSCQELWEN